MCGIAGLMSADGTAPARQILDTMASAIGHRGPDGIGHYAAHDVLLVQTRLAIIDLETGDQPLYAANGDDKEDVCLIANGEIYNYVELRAQMGDVDFKTKSDCEPILHLYLEHGLDFAEHLRGMYAIALHDPSEGALILARDPFGIKPIYYGQTADGFAFASELQALLAAQLAKPVVEESKRDELLALQFTTGAETPISGVYRLLPGETIVVRAGRIAERKVVSALPPGGPKKISRSDAVAAFDRVMMQSVDVHQRSDVPYGMFLSGGVDSSVVLAAMRRLNSTPVQALTAGFGNTDVNDERAHARAVAAAAGADHHEIDVQSDDFWRELPKIVQAIDDPTADYAIVPTYFLAHKAREMGLKVVLSGEGGDELFAGYGRYRRAQRPRFLGGRPMRHAAIFDGQDVLREPVSGWRDGLVFDGGEAKGYGRNRLQVAQATDCANWLPNDLLTKLDRCLMAHGVEGRVPFLDPYVADFAVTLPDNIKIRNRSGKWVLREWLSTALPESQPFTKKRGFTVPVGQWIETRGSELGPLVAAQQGVFEVCDSKAVEALFRSGAKHGKAQWTLLFYALWHQAHIMGGDASGDVYEVLSSG